MSIRAMLWVLDELKDLPAGPTLVMVALADYADEDGTCWPSQERIASRARASERSVRRHLTWLQEQGLVSVEHRWAQRGVGRSSRVSSVYRLPVGKPWAPVQEEPRRDSGEPVSAGQPIPDNLAGMKPADAVSAGQPIPDNLAGTGSYRTNRAFIPDTGDRYIEEPPIEPPSLPSIPSDADRVEGDDREGAAGAASEGSGDPSQVDDAPPPADAVGERSRVPDGDDWELIRDVLPEPMQALPAGDVARVASAIRERIDAGWRKRRIRDTLAARALPPQVRTLSGLVLARLRDDVPVDGAPPRRPTLVVHSEQPEPSSPAVDAPATPEVSLAREFLAARRAGDRDALTARGWRAWAVASGRLSADDRTGS